MKGVATVNDALGSLIHLREKDKERIRRLQVRIEEVEENSRRLRSELEKTKAELDLTLQERDAALLRLDELGAEL
jgi:septal ring factor EnvC (AmiA/AmiB activator)